MIRVGAVGCGGHATSTIWPLLAPAGLNCVAAWSRSQARVETAAERFGIPRAYTDYDRMLDECNLDAVIVVVPPSGFAPLITSAIDRGLHVFAEKPGAASAAEARTIADAAEKKGVVAMVGYMKRFGTAYARAKELMRAADFGPLTIASFKWTMGPMSDEHSSLESWLFENPIHHVDLARFFCGELDSWEAQLARTAGAEFALAVNARASNGGVVSMQLSTTGSWEQHNERVELQGVGASVTVDNVDTCISRPAFSPELVWRPNYTVPGPGTSSNSTLGFLPELSAFAAAVNEGGSVSSDFMSAGRTLEAVEQLAGSVKR
jgi:myo-inositol 2-dehydrogenase / D-chiro-inositol 1-dehydrogenase